MSFHALVKMHLKAGWILAYPLGFGLSQYARYACFAGAEYSSKVEEQEKRKRTRTISTTFPIVLTLLSFDVRLSALRC